MQNIEVQQVIDSWIQYMVKDNSQKESFIDLLSLGLSNREMIELINAAIEDNVSITEKIKSRQP